MTIKSGGAVEDTKSPVKGIILAGGSGSRLHPLTCSVSKQLMPVYDKPMIYYPVSILMLADIRDILIITTARDIEGFKALLGDGSDWGVSFSYKIQEKPEGLAQAFILGEDFIGEDSVCLILGDNIFSGPSLSAKLNSASKKKSGATVFAYYVKDPERYGVVSFDDSGKVSSIEEKPKKPKSNYAVTGLYFFDNEVIDIAKSLKPSSRGELEITDVIKAYLEKEDVQVEMLERGHAWLDTGTHDSLLDASNYIRIIEERQGLKVCCPEEVALNRGFISEDQLMKLAKKYQQNSYGTYLKSLIK